MSRLFAPALGVLLLAILVGCGGDTSSSGIGITDTSTTGTSGTSGTSGTTSLLAPAGTYTAALTSTVGTTTVTGTGTATAAANGTITLSLAAANTSNATARALTAVVATDGTVTGTTTVGTAAAAPLTSGALARQTDGTYRLTTAFTNAAAAAETDVYTLTAAQVAYNVAGTGTDTFGGRYTDSGMATIGASSTLTLSYTSSRAYSGATIPRSATLSTTLLSSGAFSGLLHLDLDDYAVTGTWTLGANNVLTLKLVYTNSNLILGSARGATVTETLTLTQ